LAPTEAVLTPIAVLHVADLDEATKTVDAQGLSAIIELYRLDVGARK
jgi:hypothetical protein